MHPKLELIAAASENMGIGIEGRLPWRLKNEMAYFTRMTSTTKNPSKKNAVLMGRVTWECIPKKYKPLNNRINIVLSSRAINTDGQAIVCKSIPEVLEKFSLSPYKDEIERIWVIGGSSVYKAAMESPNFHRLYLTEIKKYFECDTFFPPIDQNHLKLIKDADVPEGVQEEEGIRYEYKVYKKF